MEHLNSVLWAAEPLPACLPRPRPQPVPRGQRRLWNSRACQKPDRSIELGVPLSAQLGSLSLHQPYSGRRILEVEQT